MSKLTLRERSRKVGYAFLFGLIVTVLFLAYNMLPISIRNKFGVAPGVGIYSTAIIFVYVISVVMKIVFDSLDI